MYKLNHSLCFSIIIAMLTSACDKPVEPGSPLAEATDENPNPNDGALFQSTMEGVVQVDTTPNVPPVAIITNPEIAEVIAGEDILFIGGDSHDPDRAGTNDPSHGITHYAWDFGDGQIAEGPTLTQVTHRFDSGGVFIVTLTVTDAAGATSTDQYTLNITSKASFDGSYTLDETIQYSCRDILFGYTILDIEIDTLAFAEESGMLEVRGAPSFVNGIGNNVVMSQALAPSEDPLEFDVMEQVPGGCTETYSAEGTFTGPDTWEGTVSFRFEGTHCGLTDCTGATFDVIGTRQ